MTLLTLIGLTGNIATGKSLVARMLGELGAHVVDADALVHELERQGTPVYHAILAEFGPGILRQDGEIDRGKLGALVFGDPRALQRLEAIVHPAVEKEIERQISNLAQPPVGKSQISNPKSANQQIDKHLPWSVWRAIPTVPGSANLQSLISNPQSPREASRVRVQSPIVIEAIKLIEAGLHRRCNQLWVVVSPPELQLERLIKTRGLSEADARMRIEAQPPQSDKAALADVVLHNDGSLDELRAQVLHAWTNLSP